MKSESITLLAAISLLTVSHGESLQRPPMRKAPSNEELLLRLKQSNVQMATMAKSKPLSSAVDPSVTQPPQDFMSASEILCFNGGLTFVPKRAVLGFPKNLADRLKAKPGSSVQSWPTFYAANRAWITTVEVTKLQAQGRQALSEDDARHITKSGKMVVVATLLGNPVSVNPILIPEPPATLSTLTPAKQP